MKNLKKANVKDEHMSHTIFTGMFIIFCLFGKAGIAQQLISNPGFETGSFTPWIIEQGTATVDSSDSYSGTYAAKLSSTDRVKMDISGLNANTAYYLVCYPKLGPNKEETDSIWMGVKDFDNSSTNLFVSSKSTSYAKRSLYFTTGSTNTSATIYFACNMVSEYAFMDSFGLYETNKFADYYISENGDDETGDGSLNFPIATIHHALDIIYNIQSDVTIQLRGGTYSLPIIRIRQAGNGSNWLTIKNYNGERAILDGSNIQSTDPAPRAIFAVGKNYEGTIENLRIQGLDLTGIVGNTKKAIYVTGSFQNLEILNNKIYDNHWTAEEGSGPGQQDDPNQTGTSLSSITVWNYRDDTYSTGLTIKGNTIYDISCGYAEAISLKGKIDGFLVEDNVIYDHKNIAIITSGFDLDRITKNGVLRGNIAYNCHSPIAPVSPVIYVSGTKNTIVENNLVHHGAVAIRLGSEKTYDVVKNVIARNNLLHNNDVIGILLGTNDGALCDSIYAYGNTLYHNTLGTKGYSNAEIAYKNGNHIVIRNNIIYSNTYNNKNTIYNSFGATSTTNITTDYNLIYTDTGNLDNATFKWPNSTGDEFTLYTSFSSFKSATGQDTHSIVDDPEFDDEPGFNFKVDRYSPIINQGDPNYIEDQYETDFWGNNRVSQNTIDIGAYEHNSYIENFGFETGSLPPWSIDHGQATAVKHNAKSGNYAVRLKDDTKITQGIDIEPNTTYAFNGYVKASSSGGTAHMGVTDYGGSDLGLDVLTTYYTQDPISILFTTGSTNDSATISFSQIETSGIAFGDDFSIVKSDFQNPGFETGNISPWIILSGTPSLSTITSNVRTGSYALTFNGGKVMQLIKNLKPSTTYNFSFWAKKGSFYADTRTIYFGIEGATDTINTTVDYTRYSVNFTTGSLQTSVVLEMSSPHWGNYVDDIALIEGTTPKSAHIVKTLSTKHREDMGDLIVFPNPVEGVLSIKNDTYIDRVTLVDIYGRLCFVADEVNAKYYSIHADNFPTGVLILTIVDDSGLIRTKKIIKK